jgi:hypothetical protein
MEELWYTKRPANGFPSADLSARYVSRFCFLSGPCGREKRMGEWEFATLSFPDHWHLAPNFTRRVSLAVSFPTLRRFAGTIAIRCGPAAEPAPGVATADISGETSQPGVYAPASASPPDPVRMRLRTASSSPLPQGRHRTIRSRSFALRHGSCLLSLKLRSVSQSVHPVFGGFPLIRSLSRLRGHHRLPGASRSERSLRDDLVPFRIPNCEAGICGRLFRRPKPPGIQSPHWLTVATSGHS